MIKKIFRAFSLLGLSFVLPVSALAQCKDQLCQNLQTILYASVTDFREYRTNSAAAPDLSIEGAKIPCQMSVWANNVPMYICYAQIPFPSAESWYTSILADLRILQPTWQVKINSPVSDHFVDAGLPDCEVPATEGPYRGHCPLHLQITKDTDGTAKVYLWISSLSSPYLVNRPHAPPSKAAGPTVPVGCDDLCQSLKMVFEARLNSFAEIRSAKGDSSGASEVKTKLPGAGECAVNAVVKLHSIELGTQYVCYWPEQSRSAADMRFRDLIARFQVLVPSNWSTREEQVVDDLTGAKITAWLAVEPGDKHEVDIYFSTEFVGLHIKSWN